jgi:hypothetical protein
MIRQPAGRCRIARQPRTTTTSQAGVHTLPAPPRCRPAGGVAIWDAAWKCPRSLHRHVDLVGGAQSPNPVLHTCEGTMAGSKVRGQWRARGGSGGVCVAVPLLLHKQAGPEHGARPLWRLLPRLGAQMPRQAVGSRQCSRSGAHQVKVVALRGFRSSVLACVWLPVQSLQEKMRCRGQSGNVRICSRGKAQREEPPARAPFAWRRAPPGL